MKVSLKTKILTLIVILTVIPVALYFYHLNAMKERIINEKIDSYRFYAYSIVSKVELYLERVISETETLIYLYKNLGFEEKEIIWRVTGHIKGIFEGAFYSREGKLITFESREKIFPSFDREIKEPILSKKILGIYFTQYKEPYLRFGIPLLENGMLKGFFIFSLDLSLFWQSVISSKPSPSAGIFLADSKGKLLAFSDMRFSKNITLPLREGVYRSEILGVDVVGTYVRSEDKKWIVIVEEPLFTALIPIYRFQYTAMIFGTVFMLSAGILAVFILLRIFKPLEDLRNFIISWEKENINRPVKSGDEVSELYEAFNNLINKLEEERKLYINLFENTLDGIIVFNREKKVVDVNRRVLEEFKVKKEEIIGRSMKELIGEELPEKGLFISEAALKLGNAEYFCQLKQDLLDIEGKRYIIWRIRNVSEEKELKILLEKTAKLSMVGEIACSIAHQINNPLASIMGYAESIMLTSRDEKAAEKAEIIFKHAQKCAETVRKLLNLAKPLEGEPKKTDVEKITVEAISLLTSKAKKKDVKIKFENLLNERETVLTFPWQLEHALINVIDNAIDASYRGGTVEVLLKREDNTILWIIKDKGKGISKEEIENVFKPFYTTKKEGTGLGLPVAKRFIENLGGKIELRSEENKGTEVRIHLRLNEGSKA